VLRSAGLRVAFLSNNSAVPIDAVVAKLERCGYRPLSRCPDQRDGGRPPAARLVAGGAKVLTCGGPGVVEALEAAGSSWSTTDRVKRSWLA